jgi:glycosyltransferase involved in cell wall biosynthesis
VNEFSPQTATASGPVKPRLHFMTNGIFTTSVAGGDLHCFDLARTAIAAGYDVNFWGGHALQQVLKDHGVHASLTLNDNVSIGKTNTHALKGQFSLFRDFFGRYRSTMRQLGKIQPGDIVYAVSDYWFDVLPVVRSKARRKLMVWHMQAPSLGQIIRRSRPDVDPARLASLHYWASQNYSLRTFRRCRTKKLFHVHPAMRPKLLAMGYRADELQYMSFGMDSAPPPGSEAPEKEYDACWIGRVHRQKGIDDLVATLAFLAKQLPGFRAVMIGNVKAGLEPRIKEWALEKHVHFSGFVSETEKFRLFSASRVFLMPSKFEGSPRVVGESLLCGTPVIAYEVETYRPIFGDLLRYVPCFDVNAFQQAALDQIKELRSGNNPLAGKDLSQFINENSWEMLRSRFLSALESL